MKRPPTLKTAMTPFPHSVESSAPLKRARQLMKQYGVHHLPVTEDHTLIGIITERDIGTRGKRPKTAGGGDISVKDACVLDAYIVDLNEPLDNVLLTMSRQHIDSAIVTRHGRLAGVFTSADACRCFGEYLKKNFPRDDGGAAA